MCGGVVVVAMSNAGEGGGARGERSGEGAGASEAGEEGGTAARVLVLGGAKSWPRKEGRRGLRGEALRGGGAFETGSGAGAS